MWGKNFKVMISRLGDSRFRLYTGNKSEYDGFDGIIFLYDVSNKESFEKAKELFTETKEANLAGKLFVGNKIDLEENHVVQYKEVIEFTERVGVGLVEISVKTGEKMEEMLEMMAQKILCVKYSSLGKQVDWCELVVEWNPKTHHLFPKSFREAVAAFLFCLRRFQDEGDFKVPKFVLFEILKFAKESKILVSPEEKKANKWKERWKQSKDVDKTKCSIF